jgi:hypothetical protein
MSRAFLVLANDMIRAKAADWCRRLPKDTRIEFKGPKRTIPQNDRMWAMLTDVSQQVKWHGLKLSADDWKLIFLDGLGHELRMVPNINGTGFVNLGRSSSKLSVEEMTNLIELIFAFGAQHGVVFGDEANKAA